MPSRLEAIGAQLISDDAPQTPAVWCVRLFLAGCACLYTIGLEAYLGAERVGLRKRGHMPVPVVSIGNLSVGGTGKTPFTQMLCRLLTAQGKRVAVLSRGHGSVGHDVRIVSDASGQVLANSDEAGDEPLLLARTLPGIPVVVGKDRRLTGRNALQSFGLDALVLDDGFQFWQLARTLDIVLLDAQRPFDNGWPLPRGLLREPKKHLGRAQIVVVTRADNLGQTRRNTLSTQIARLAPKADVFFAHHEASGFVSVLDLAGPLLPLELLRGKPVAALSGIAQPQSFAQTLVEDAKANLLQHFVYADHARYSESEAEKIYSLVVLLRADALVMTEKDAVKWPLLGSNRFPVYALRVQMRVENEARFTASVMRLLFNQG